MDTRRDPAPEAANAQAICDFLEAFIAARLAEAQGQDAALPEPALCDDGGQISRLLTRHRAQFDEFVVLALALVPHLRPALLEEASAAPGQDPPAQMGGWRHGSGVFLPTGETAAFLLAGGDLSARIAVQRLFGPDHWFARDRILHLEDPDPGAPILSGRLVLANDWVARLTLGAAARPGFGPGFPAQQVTTPLGWDDLVLPPQVRAQIRELEDWQRHHATLLRDWGMAGRLRPGYRALFHGPSGTGKTLTATLLGKALNRDVFRVDLSTVVSKYIGETEKNLASLFAQAEKLDAILFFDEADALFGKRTAVKDAHDRYANQEVSYLLQRVEDYDGLVILATNFRANLDDAFLRRFNAIIPFPMPGADERRQIWQGCLPDRGERDAIAARMAVFELSGGAILNVAQHAALSAIAAGRDAPDLRDALHGVRREVEKDGKVFRNLLPDVPLKDL
ncbi:MAG: ATP-binding protein [Rhodobacteraceae bacterium]|nr:ATP-binding protein [Paracoccaceae bacterium]